MNSYFINTLLIIIFFAGCTTCLEQAKPIKKQSKATVVLLNNNKTHNAVIVSNNKGSQTLDKVGEFLEIQDKNRKLVQPKILSKEELEKRFGDILAINIPQPKTYRIYFKKGTLELTYSSQVLIDTIVNTIIKKAPSITDIIGHTDTVGSEEKNMEKSIRQAFYIEYILKKAIINTCTNANISLRVKGYGETDLLIPTANNVAEERNRNVEIFIK